MKTRYFISSALMLACSLACAAGGAVFVQPTTSSASAQTTATAAVSGMGSSVSHADMRGVSGAKINDATLTLQPDNGVRATIDISGGSSFTGNAYNYSSGGGTGSAAAAQTSTFFASAEILTCGCEGVSARGTVSSGSFSYFTGEKVSGSNLSLEAGSNQGVGGFLSTSSTANGYSYRLPGAAAISGHSAVVNTTSESVARLFKPTGPEGQVFTDGFGQGTAVSNGKIFFPSQL